MRDYKELVWRLTDLRTVMERGIDAEVAQAIVRELGGVSLPRYRTWGDNVPPFFGRMYYDDTYKKVRYAQLDDVYDWWDQVRILCKQAAMRQLVKK